MARFMDGWGVGFAVGILTLLAVAFLMTWAYKVGHFHGWEQAIVDQERQGGGRWIEVRLEGRLMQGWVKP